LAVCVELAVMIFVGLFAVSALKAFKQAISEDPLSKLSDWNTLSGDPCSWSGVACSQNQVLSM